MNKENNISSMDGRETLLKTIQDNLSVMFVEQYDKVNSARKSINSYLKDIDIEYQYDYNIFCLDFMENSKNLVNHISEDKLEELDDMSFVSEIMSIMVKNKIHENIKDETKKAYLMVQHELKKFLIDR